MPDLNLTQEYDESADVLSYDAPFLTYDGSWQVGSTTEAPSDTGAESLTEADEALSNSPEAND